MAVPPLRLGDRFESYISGNAIVHESAVLAPGVIIHANGEGKIIIGAGVCIGMGTVLQIDTGILEVKAGANLGAGVLIVGAATIGENACIGTATTICSCSVAPAQIVPPGSMLGNLGRQPSTIPLSAANSAEEVSVEEQLPDLWDDTGRENLEDANSKQNHVGKSQQTIITEDKFSLTSKLEFGKTESTKQESSSGNNHEDESNSQLTNTSSSDSPSADPSLQQQNSSQSPPSTAEYSETFGTQIYGQTSVQRLLTTLFPHRQALNQPVSDDESE